MKILTATRQGADRADDFCYAVEGEIVTVSVVCDSPRCGCDRALGGLNSHRATTTVMVREVDLTIDDLGIAALGYLETSGWAEHIARSSTPEDGPEPVKSLALELVQFSADIASDFDEGAVLRVAYDRVDGSYRFQAA